MLIFTREGPRSIDDITILHAYRGRRVGQAICVIALLNLFMAHAIAQQVPRTVEGYALQLEEECEAGLNPNPLSEVRSSELIKRAADGPKGTIFVVDGAYTRCGDSAPLCGTGGCPLGVFRLESGVTTSLYDDQAFSWTISRDGSNVVLRVHGSICGGVGPDPCAIEINLSTGKKKTFQPRD